MNDPIRNLIYACLAAGITASCLTTSAHGQLLFTDVTANSPDLTENFVSSPGDGHGPGLVFTDLNNDGYADLYLVRAYGQSNGLFVNTPGAGGTRTFIRQPGAGAVETSSNSNGAIAADYDNDGDKDLFVINWDQPNQLFKNNLIETGQLGFTDATASTDPTPGVSDTQRGLAKAWGGKWLNYSLTAAWADPDRDGDLDLYVGNHHEFYLSPTLNPGDKPGQRDIFYQNNGDGTFTDVTIPLGMEGFETATGSNITDIQNYSSTNAVIWADFNNDQWPDLLVSNKIGGPDDRDMLYINNGDDAQGNWLGMSLQTYNLPTQFGRRTAGAMGIAVADLENDGDLDIYLTDWSNLDNAPGGGQNDVWVNQFADTGTLNFVHSNQQPGIYSWGTQWEDFDNNGYSDIYATSDTGVPDNLYMNGPNGMSTTDTAVAAGLTETLLGRGSAAADFNRDGRMDLMVINPWSSSNGDGKSVLYENTYAGGNHFLVLELIGDHTRPGPRGHYSTRDAIGARVTVHADLDGDGVIDDNEKLIREVASGSSNAASTSSLGLEFGVGAATQVTVHVVFPSGREMWFPTLADQYLVVDERTILTGDLDGDGFVGILDLTLVLGNWNQIVPAGPTQADPTGDGFIGISDLNMILGNWNAGTPPGLNANIPEPAAASVLVSMFLLSVGRRRGW